MLKHRSIPAVVAFVILMPLLVAACSDVPASFGKYYRGKTLDLNIVALERTPMLRYYRTDSAGIKRHYSISPASVDASVEMELVMLRVKVENHTATSAIVNVDENAAELRGFLRDKYFPININERVTEESGPPENPGDERCAGPGNERCIVFLWNRTFVDGTDEAFELRDGYGVDGWLVFEAPVDTQFRSFRWRAGDSLSIDF